MRVFCFCSLNFVLEIRTSEYYLKIESAEQRGGSIAPLALAIAFVRQ